MNDKKFGKFDLLKKIGEGGMAELYLARQSGIEGFEKLVAIKVILPHLVDSTSFTQMFLDEARLAATLDHPNIVQIFDLGRVGDQFYIAMEYLNGVDLHRILKREQERRSFFPIAHAVKILSYVCEALHYAHNKSNAEGKFLNLVHRDVSPQNVLVAFSGGVKLTDFGIAKASSRTIHTQVHALKGKFCFMSPEQGKGGELDRRSDIFSVGILLYLLTTGKLPFLESSGLATLKAIEKKKPASPTASRPDFPVGLAPILERALAKNPTNRFPDAHSMQIALEEFLAGQKLFSNSTTIGQYVSELFKDVVLSQTKQSPDGKTVTVKGIISGLEIVADEKEPRPSPAEPNFMATRSIAAFLKPSGLISRVRGLFAKWKGTLGDSPAQQRRLFGRALPHPSPEGRAAVRRIHLVASSALALAIAGAALIYHVLPNVPNNIPPTTQPSLVLAPAIPENQAEAQDLATASDTATDPVRPTVEELVLGLDITPSDGDDETTSGQGKKEPRPKNLNPVRVPDGFLTIDSQPWAEVWFQGEKLGLTPLAYKKLPVGRHSLVLVNSRQGILKTVQVRIRSHKTTTLSLDLRKD